MGRQLPRGRRHLTLLSLRTEEGLAAGGDAVARAPDGRVVFVEGACPSEQVEAEVTRDNPRFLRARVLTVIAPGPARVIPECRYFGECGGCTLQHIGPVEQTRARFAVTREAIGYRRRGSNAVLDVSVCPILAPPLQTALDELRASRPPLGEVSVVAPDETAPIAEESDVFAQANAAGNRALVAYIAELATGAPRVLELYAGSGNFTRVLGANVHAIEASAQAVQIAAEEGIKIERAPVERALESLGPGFDLVVLDPPRAGVSEEAIAHLLRLAAPRIVYVSCDPATMSRDIKRLETYRVDRVRVFDLYPQTGHVEVVTSLRIRT